MEKSLGECVHIYICIRVVELLCCAHEAGIVNRLHFNKNKNFKKEYKKESTLQTIDKQDITERKAMRIHTLLDGQRETAPLGGSQRGVSPQVYSCGLLCLTGPCEVRELLCRATRPSKKEEQICTFTGLERKA